MLKKLCILSDFLQEDMSAGLGGAEAALAALIELLRPDNKLYVKRCSQVTPEFIREFDGPFIVSNRQHLSEECRQELYKKKYFLYEHDFAFLKSRNAGDYEDFRAPEDQIINRDLYNNAAKIIVQGDAQKHGIKVNLGIEAVSTSGNPWLQSSLDYLKSLQSVEKEYQYGILLHPYPTKGTDSAVKLCEDNGWEYKLIPPAPNREFLQELAKYQILVFTPQIFETYWRVGFEARALGVDLIMNQNVGFQYEKHSKLKRLELIEYAEENNKKIKDIFNSIHQ